MSHFAINIGIGDIITSKSYLLDLVRRGRTVTVRPTHRHLNMRGAGYAEFVQRFMELVFFEPGFIVESGDTKTEPSHWAQLRRDGLKQHIVDLSGVLPLASDLTPLEPYICVNTKVRQYSRSRFLTIKDSLLSVLANLPTKVAIVGEKVVEQNVEYAIHGDDVIYSIYNYLMELPQDKIIDLTVPALGLSTPDLATLRKDCYIMAQSRCVVNIGYGGNLSLSGSVAKNVNLIGPNQIYEGVDVVGVIQGMFGTRTQCFIDEGAFLTYLQT